jgi:hypothetical protein
MNTNYDVLCKFFAEIGPKVTSDPDEHLVALELPLEHTTVEFAAAAPPEADHFELAMLLPVRVPQARRPAVGEFLHRVNWRLKGGGWELDFDTGHVMYHTCQCLDPTQALTECLLRRWFVKLCMVVDWWFQPLMSVAFSNVAATHAFEQGEARFEEPQDQLRRHGLLPRQPPTEADTAPEAD